ncbi:MAG: hypothetical protein ILA02_01200 [Clostridia bacterium]|nr:hypothetical protein [Clostridia bacterium]
MITIIVMLILAAISISMLTGDNSILKRATDSKKNTEESQITEEAKIDILAKITDNEGKAISKKQLKDVLKNYFNEEEIEKLVIPDDLSSANDELTTKDEKYKIKLSDIYNGKVENRWEYDHALQTVENGNLTLKIGDYVNTTPYIVDGKQFDGRWRVLGEENGQVLLVSANYVDFEGSTEQSGVPVMTLQGSNGIDNEIAKLNNLGAKFADGTKTEKGRSIKVEDVNRITGYDPTDARLDKNDLTKKGLYGKDETYQYGNNVTYTIKSDGEVWYKGDQAVTTEKSSDYTKFIKLGESSNITEPFTVKSTYYNYYPETLGNFQGSAVTSGQNMEGISTSSPAYDMLFKPQSNISYWLASPCVNTYAGIGYWALFIVSRRGTVDGGSLWRSNNGSYSCTYGVRPAVALKSTITPTLKSTDETTGISTYEI